MSFIFQALLAVLLEEWAVTIGICMIFSIYE